MTEINVTIEDIKDQLLELALNEEGYTYGGYAQTPTSMLMKNVIKRAQGPQRVKGIHGELRQALLEKVAPVEGVSVVILHCSPHFVVDKHVDDESEANRKTCISWALSPDLEYFAPSLFYTDGGIQEHKYTHKGYLLDTRIPHGMINNEHHRYLVQVTLNAEPSEVARILKR